MSHATLIVRRPGGAAPLLAGAPARLAYRVTLRQGDTADGGDMVVGATAPCRGLRRLAARKVVVSLSVQEASGVRVRRDKTRPCTASMIAASPFFQRPGRRRSQDRKSTRL